MAIKKITKKIKKIVNAGKSKKDFRQVQQVELKTVKIVGPINKKMIIGDVAEKYPKAVEVMFKFGLHCIGCHVSPFESIEQGSLAHGLSSKQIDEMVKEMNVKVEKKK